jgi:hypothetical protein
MIKSIAYTRILLLGLALSLAACNDSPLQSNDRDFGFSFEQGLEGWVGDFADYPVGEEDFYELNFGHSALPDPLDASRGALKISGNNHSDDLFMFVKRKISGLEPNATYSVAFDLRIGSDAPNGSFGVGGSPVIPIKIGATQIEPVKVLSQEDSHYRMNIDKGQQFQEGVDMKIIGDTANGTDEFKYVVIERRNTERPFEITTDDNGEVWIVIGTDSSFEATTTLFYDSIHLTFKLK